jgi:cytochrome P450
VPDAVVAYNPFEPGFADDPYPQYATLRTVEPVHESPFGAWILFSYADVVRFLRDLSLSVEDHNARSTLIDEVQREVLDDSNEVRDRAMLFRDPPDHTRLRRLVSKAFTPRRIEALRPRIEGLVDDSLDRAAAAGGFELISDFAFPLPFTVISELLGTPSTDTDALREWSGLLVRNLEPVLDPDMLRAMAAAAENMHGLVSDVIAWKRAHPADDLLSAMIAAEEHGDVLTDEELVAQTMLLYIAGHETTVNLIGNGVLALLRHPDQLAALRADPSLDVNAVEELLRYDSPVQMSRRITLADVEVGGKTVEAGTFVVLSLASANRDAEFWGERADTVDLRRADAPQHVSFGGGHHFCLGAALARLEAQVAIGRLVRRFPALTPAAEPAWNGRLNLRGLERLPLRV